MVFGPGTTWKSSTYNCESWITNTSMRVILVTLYALCASLTVASPIADDPSSLIGVDTFGRHCSKSLFSNLS